MPIKMTPAYQRAWAFLFATVPLRTSEWDENLKALPQWQQEAFTALKNRPQLLGGFPMLAYPFTILAPVLTQPHTPWEWLVSLAIAGVILFAAEAIMSRKAKVAAQLLGGEYVPGKGLVPPRELTQGDTVSRA